MCPDLSVVGSYYHYDSDITHSVCGFCSYMYTVYSSLAHAEVSQKYPLACTGFTVYSGLVASGFALLWIY